jgi:hypothetical protein
VISLFLYLLIIVFVFVCIALSFYHPREIKSYIIEIKYFLGIYSLHEQNQFLKVINHLISSPQVGKNILPERIPRYKNYQDLLFIILENVKNFGAPKNAPLMDLKKSLEVDFKFDRKINKLIQETIIQVFVLSLFTWGFLIAIKFILSIKLSITLILFIFLLQIFGFIITVLILLYGKKRCFSHQEILFAEVIKIKGLIQVGLPLGYLSKEIMWEKLDKLEPGLCAISNRLNTAIKATLEGGHSIKEEIDAIIKEIEAFFETKVDYFQNQLKFLQFLSMSFFQLPAFLMVIYYLLSQSFQSL